VELRGAGQGEVVHGVDIKRYRRLPYLAADPRSNSEVGERRRWHGLEAAAQTEAAAALDGLGFGAVDTGHGLGRCRGPAAP
jgi:hypothetical protein